MIKIIALLAAVLLASPATASYFGRPVAHYAAPPAAQPGFSSLSALHAAVARGDCVCTREYNPTCCLGSNGPRTASNPCTCGCDGGSPIHAGECQVCACPLIYQPVCCVAYGRSFTASNECGCRCAYGRVDSQGPCPGIPPTPPGDSDLSEHCNCNKAYNPVCCRRGSDYKTIGNTCTCECAGGIVAHPGTC